MKTKILLLSAVLVISGWQASGWLAEGLTEFAPLLSRSERRESTLGLSYGSSGYELPKIVSYEPYSGANASYSWQIINDSNEQDSTYKSVLAYELAKYPESFFDDIGLKGIFVVDDIINGHDRSALGFADTMSKHVYLNQTGGSSAESELIRSTIHHEIGHLAIIATRGFSSLNDSHWLEINNNFIYGASNSASSYFPAEGFVSDYAMTSVAEDMAEVFAFGMSDSYSQAMRDQAVGDRALNDKISIISSELAKTSLQWPVSQLVDCASCAPGQ